MVTAAERTAIIPKCKIAIAMPRGGKSFGMARDSQPVLDTYVSPLTTSRMSEVRLPPRWMASFATVVAKTILVRPIGDIPRLWT